MKKMPLLLLLFCSITWVQCQPSVTSAPIPRVSSARNSFPDLPSHFPLPIIPAENSLTDEKVLLGRYIFYDTRLSITLQMSCSSCHQQALAFTDGLGRAVGTTGQVHPRGAMSLTNIAYASRLAWANPLLDRLEHQALLPIFGEQPVEMGMAGNEELLLQRLESDPGYVVLFQEIWPSDGIITLERVTQAIAAFERTLISSDSPYDRFVEGDATALSDAAKRGMDLFMSERLECFHCHGGFNFSDSVDHAGMPAAEVAFHNNGLYNLDGKGAYPPDNTGVYEQSGDVLDMGRFRAPTLRNIAVTAPYMHDGSLSNLREVVEHYSAGGRLLPAGPYAGDGANNPNKSEFVSGFILTEVEVEDLLSFLNSLTDETFLNHHDFSDPFDY